ncbi:hypothetical protein EDD18DRAFT_1108304 [Armillaria luteobubalina]|uniref:Uncharacterized protein n=1 Tax=Armillaria luteobubalina TaxID=153913 RepID=A0AA39Q0M0_9AGAR|nr:hypothetical protein EDD18DRAFT_1108304 [Armillaria luteobubalina]
MDTSRSAPVVGRDFAFFRNIPRQYHQFMLPSLRRIFLVTSPNSEVDELKEELKDAKDRISSQSRRLKDQAKEHSLSMSQLTRQLDAERRQNERLKALLAETGHRRNKNPDFGKTTYATDRQDIPAFFNSSDDYKVYADFLDMAIAYCGNFIILKTHFSTNEENAGTTCVEIGIGEGRARAVNMVIESRQSTVKDLRNQYEVKCHIWGY